MDWSTLSVVDLMSMGRRRSGTLSPTVEEGTAAECGSERPLPEESQQGSQKPRPGLAGRAELSLAYSPLIHPMGFWLKSCRGVNSPPLQRTVRKERGLISVS